MGRTDPLGVLEDDIELLKEFGEELFDEHVTHSTVAAGMGADLLGEEVADLLLLFLVVDDLLDLAGSHLAFVTDQVLLQVIMMKFSVAGHN